MLTFESIKEYFPLMNESLFFKLLNLADRFKFYASYEDVLQELLISLLETKYEPTKWKNYDTFALTVSHYKLNCKYRYGYYYRTPIIDSIEDYDFGYFNSYDFNLLVDLLKNSFIKKPKYLQVLNLLLDEFSPTEIAKKLNMPKSGVSYCLQKIRQEAHRIKNQLLLFREIDIKPKRKIDENEANF